MKHSGISSQLDLQSGDLESEARSFVSIKSEPLDVNTMGARANEPKCYGCGKPGHKRVNCQERKQMNGFQGNRQNYRGNPRNNQSGYNRPSQNEERNYNGNKAIKAMKEVTLVTEIMVIRNRMVTTVE